MAGSIFRIFDNGEGVQIAVGADGLLITSLDGGITWANRNSGTQNNLYGAAFGVTVGPTEGFVVVGANGTILTSPDAVSWLPRISFTPVDLYDVTFSSVMMAVGANGAFGISDDLGLSWEAKPSNTQEDLVSITADLGSYLIVGTNDTVIVGTISTLNQEILIQETIAVTHDLESQGNLQRVVEETVEVSLEDSWIHDALGAGTTITIGGTNQFVYLEDELYAISELETPAGNYNLEILEDITVIESKVDTYGRNMFGSIEWPMFETNGKVLNGSNLSGDVLFPMFRVSGSIKKGMDGSIIWPMFSTNGIVTPEVVMSGDVLIPMFYTTGTVVAASKFDATDDYEVWLLNVESGHHSTYENWQVDSMGTFNGQEIGAMPDGIYLLEGENDAGVDIDAQVMWPPSDLTSVKQKSLDAVYVRMRGQVDAIQLIAIVDETKKRYFERSMSRSSDGNVVKRIPFPRGLQGNLWQIGLENVCGDKLDLAEIEVITRELQRRIK